jgi:hypothetical protein
VSSSILQSRWDLVKELGPSLAKSGLLNLQNDKQGEVIAYSCIYHGRDPLSIPEEFHLLSGKLSLRADAMLGRLVSAGGTYQVLEHSADAAEIEVSYQDRTYRERLTWGDAQQEPFVYAGKQADILAALIAGKQSSLRLSANYATPRRRSQHLWARVVSDAVRVIAPNLIAGSYTPVEVSDWTGAALTDAAGDVKGSALVEKPQAEVVSRSAREEPIQPTAPEPVYSDCLDDIVSDSEVTELRDLIARVSQSVPGLAQAVRDRLSNQGLKLADLSKHSAHELRTAIEAKELAAIAEAMLTPGKLEAMAAASAD